MRKAPWLTVLSVWLILSAQAQVTDSSLDRMANFPNRLFSKIQSKSAELRKSLDRKTAKFLTRLSKKEAKLKKKLYRQDSAAAARIFASRPEQLYTGLLEKYRTDSASVMRSMGAEYLPYLDSMQGALSFLNKNPKFLSVSGALPPGFASSFDELRQLETKMQYADQIKQVIQARKAQILQYLTDNSQVLPGIKSLYNKYNSELYYYSEQVREYRQILNDPDKMLKAALLLLNKLPVFASFMHNNSFLAGLFNIPPDYGTDQGMEGLQSRDQILSMIQSQVGQGGPNAASMIQQNLHAASQDITKLQKKLNALGGGSGDMDMPNFKPNQQRTRTFLQRLDYGTNIQTQQSSYYFPSTTDIGLSLGYKLNNKSTLGIGASYKIGWGSDFQHIQFSSQGVSLRSFLDWQMKKSFYISGGYELNYQEPISGLRQLMIPNSWQSSGLIGISKIVSLKTKVFKQTKIQLLWDFLHYLEPINQSLKFRVGYNF
jgi:hypothetical protein